MLCSIVLDRLVTILVFLLVLSPQLVGRFVVQSGHVEIALSLVEAGDVREETALKSLRHVFAQKQPLLDEYLSLWKRVLSCQSARLLVAEHEQFVSCVSVDVVEVKDVALLF